MTHESILKALPPRPIGAEVPDRFELFVRGTLTMVEFEQLRGLFGSSHARHKAMKDPARITPPQCIVMAGMLGVTAWHLHKRYGVAHDHITYEEACIWWLLDQQEEYRKTIDYALKHIADTALSLISSDDAPLLDDEEQRHDSTPAKHLATATG